MKNMIGRAFLLVFVSLLLILVSISSVQAQEPIWTETTDKTVSSLAISGNATTIAVGGEHLYLFNQSGQQMGVTWKTEGVAVNRSGDLVAAAMDDGVHMLDVSGHDIWVLPLLSTSCVAMTPNASQIVAGTKKGVIAGIDKNGGLIHQGELTSLSSGSNVIWAAAMSENGSMNVVSDIDGLYAFDGSGHDLWRLGFIRPVSLGMTWNGSMVAAGGTSGVLICNRTGVEMGRYYKGNAITTVAVPVNGTFAIAGDEKGTLIYLNSAAWPQWTYPAGSPITSVSVTADGALIAAGTEDGSLMLFGNSGYLFWKTKLPSSVTALGFSPDGWYLGAGTSTGTVALFPGEARPVEAGQTNGQTTTTTTNTTSGGIVTYPTTHSTESPSPGVVCSLLVITALLIRVKRSS
ncbi:WD40 repeat domain-containing protein [Methanosphaerula palustris]|nr:WD40 repeat domain-containing protein [Methanosphaerula palustris]